MIIYIIIISNLSNIPVDILNKNFKNQTKYYLNVKIIEKMKDLEKERYFL